MNQTTSIIAVTASPTLRGSKDMLDNAGVSGLLVKPITRRHMFGIVSRCVGEGEVAWMSDAWARRSWRGSEMDAAAADTSTDEAPF